MGDTAPRAKRKRSAIACIACHDRKVRCNAAHQGIPCSNCLEDGVNCEIYRRSPQMYEQTLRSPRTSSADLVQPQEKTERRRPTPSQSYLLLLQDKWPVANITTLARGDVRSRQLHGKDSGVIRK